MIESIEELSIKFHADTFGNLKRLSQINIRIVESGTRD